MRIGNSRLEALAAEQCSASRCETAISLFEAAFTKQPCHAELSYQIGLCYSGVCRRHSLVSLPLAIAFFERALSLSREGSPDVRAQYLDALGNARQANHQPARAVPPLVEAALIYASLGLPQDWARTEYNLGNAYCALAERRSASMWEKAVRHYLRALRVRTEKADPLRFAATAQNLGTAYRQLVSGNSADNLRRAIGCYSAAFRVYMRTHLEEKCADLHNNLGNAYLNLTDRPQARCRYIRRAMKHYTLSLRTRTKIARLHDYAVTQFNRGQGYAMLADCEATGNIQPAAACFREALNAFLLSGDAARAEMVMHRLHQIEASRPAVPTPAHTAA